jgi:hypothetical protein
MKKLNFSIILLVTGLIFFSCKSGNPRFTTVINPDGSCSKEIEADGDSAFMVGDTAKSNPLEVDLDSSWKISWSYLTSEEKTEWPLKKWTRDTTHKQEMPRIKARHDYQSVEEMGKTFRLTYKHKWRDIRPAYSLEKKFRWFYTYYLYREVYPQIKTLTRIPFDRYFTKEEAEFWFNGKQDLIRGMNGIEIKEEAEKIEEKFNFWFGHNIWDEEYEILLKNYNLLTKPTITVERLKMAKDSIFLKNVHYMKLLSDNNRTEEEKDFGTMMDDYFKTNVFSELYNLKGNPLKAYEEGIDEWPFMKYFESDINYNLLLPGTILEAGNAVLHNDTLSYNLSAYRMVYSDYEIRATSRKANVWAFVVTGIIVVLAVGSMFVRK